MITQATRLSPADTVQYVWLADRGRMLFTATYDPARGVDGFLADLAYSGPELGPVTESGDILTLVWRGELHERHECLRPGHEWRITLPGRL